MFNKNCRCLCCMLCFVCFSDDNVLDMCPFARASKACYPKIQDYPHEKTNDHILAWIPDSRHFQPVPGRKFHIESEIELNNHRCLTRQGKHQEIRNKKSMCWIIAFSRLCFLLIRFVARCWPDCWPDFDQNFGQMLTRFLPRFLIGGKYSCAGSTVTQIQF